MIREAPAKINLRLEIVGRRVDGYHQLRSIMVPVTLTDRLTFEVIESGVEFTCDDPTIPGNGANLVVRAAKALLAETGAARGVKIHLEKRIPSAAGLGGGSSDAATTLLAVRDLLALEIEAKTLHNVAIKLGADVPFFLANSSCLIQGIGEDVQPYNVKSDLVLALVKPSRGLSTPEVYRALNWPLTQKVKLNKLPPAIGDLESACANLCNDLEPPARELLPEVVDCKEFLRAQGAAGVLMSGSGPTVFGIFDDNRRAEAACEAARERQWWAYSCRTA
jgi:4-diphosphocytidyl-2-C-methyl-D-erythritol kinase